MTRRNRLISFTVTFERPPAASVAEMAAYIQEAVATWRGQTRPPGSYDRDDPGNPMWELDGDTVVVTRRRDKARPVKARPDRPATAPAP